MSPINTNSLFTTVKLNCWNLVHAQWWNELLTGQHFNCYTLVDVIGYFRHPPLSGYRTAISSMYGSGSSVGFRWNKTFVEMLIVCLIAKFYTVISWIPLVSGNSSKFHHWYLGTTVLTDPQTPMKQLYNVVLNVRKANNYI
jgi:hypothetical protein